MGTLPVIVAFTRDAHEASKKNIGVCLKDLNLGRLNKRMQFLVVSEAKSERVLPPKSRSGEAGVRTWYVLMPSVTRRRGVNDL